jgi:phage shock protein E
MMKMKRSVSHFRIEIVLWAFLLLIAASGAGCSGSAEGSEPLTAYTQVKEQGALLLDVRTRQEFLESRIEGAKNVPVTELGLRLHEIEALVAGDRGHPIVVYCERGYRASQAREILLKAGFEKVTNLGGIRDWPETEAIQ